MKTSALALLIAACTGPADLAIEESAVTLCHYECPVCYPTCGGCVQVCHSCVVPRPGPLTGDDLPTGFWPGQWHCDSGCSMPAPDLTVATSLDLRTVPFDAVVWRGPAPNTPPILEAVTEQNLYCWHMAARAYGCQSAIDICGADCAGTACVKAKATWTDLMTGDHQDWTFTGIQ